MLPHLVERRIHMGGDDKRAGPDCAERKSRLESARRAIANHPLVTAAIELLGAELRDVRLAQDDSGDISISR